MTYDRILFSKLQPSRTDVAWAKPVTGGFALYLYFGGKWQPQVPMNDDDTINPDDDIPVDVGNIPSLENLEEKIQEEVTEQMADHDIKNHDTHNAPSSDPDEFPDVVIL